MADIVFIAVALTFFVACALYVRWCEAIIGGDLGPSSEGQEGADAGLFEDVAT